MLRMLEAPAPDVRHGDEADQLHARRAHEDSVAARARLEAHWTDILEALAKIDRGEYGIRETCGTQISERRPTVLPKARLCLPCQVAWERARPLVDPTPDADSAGRGTADARGGLGH